MGAPGTTNGPWTANGNQVETRLHGDSGPAIAIARTAGNNDEALANAQQFAASPDLYDALVAICSLVEDAFDGKLAGPQALDAITDIASPAIAKARGE